MKRLPSSSLLRRLVSLAAAGLLALPLASGCAAETEEGEGDADTEVGEDTAAYMLKQIDTSEMVRIAAPAGLPKPWVQPDSTGWFDEKGRCGPTAVANALLLYGIRKEPEKIYNDGAHWLVGSLATNLNTYLNKFHPQLGCTIEQPLDSAAFLRRELDANRPVMLLYNTEGWNSHWVTAVDHKGTGANEDVIVMSWGSYYKIKMTKLVRAWENVYGMRSPSVICTPSSQTLQRAP